MASGVVAKVRNIQQKGALRIITFGCYNKLLNIVV